MDEFLQRRGWSDELSVDPVARTISLVAGVNIGDQTGRIIVEIDETLDLVEVFFYYRIRCKKSQLDQMCLLINMIHLNWPFGRFEVVPTGTIRWRQRVDFEGSIPTGASVDAIVQPGWDACTKFLDPIAAVALTNKSAEDAMEEWRQSPDATPKRAIN